MRGILIKSFKSITFFWGNAVLDSFFVELIETFGFFL